MEKGEMPICSTSGKCIREGRKASAHSWLRSIKAVQRYSFTEPSASSGTGNKGLLTLVNFLKKSSEILPEKLSENFIFMCTASGNT